MVIKYTLYIGINLLSAALCLVLATIAFRHRDRTGARALVFLMLGVAGWCLLLGLGLFTKTTAAAYFLARIAYFFFICVPVLWIMFTYQYVRRQVQPNRLTIALLWIVPAISLTLVWTNEWHHWFWSSLEFIRTDGFMT